MSGTKYIASNWRVPENSNLSKNDNYSLSFDGGTEVLTWGQTDLPAAHTISFWVKMGGLSTDYRTILIDTTYAAFSPPVRRIYLRLGRITYIDTTSAGSTTLNTTNDVGTILTDGDWHHVVVVRNDTVGTIYIDNVDKTNDAAIGSLTTPFYLTRTGESITGYGSIFNGDLSDICFFDYALSVPQIESLAGRPETGAGNPMVLKPTPVAYYPLGDNSASDPLIQPNVAVDDASVFEFNGVNDYVGIGTTSLGITTAISVSAWVKIPVTDTGGGGANIRMIISEDTTSSGQRNWLLFWRGTGYNYFNGSVFHTDGSSSAINSTGITPNDGNWHHVMLTFDGTTDANGLKLYVDGTLFQATAGSTGIRSAAGVEPAIGSLTAGANWKFEGNLSNIVVWDSVQNINDIYNNGIPATSYTNTPVAWYKLDQSANWEADTVGDWQIPDAVSAYPQSFDFDGSDYISASPTGISSAITVSAWIRTSTTGIQTIVNEDQASSNRCWNLLLEPGNKIQVVIKNTDGTVNNKLRSTALEVQDGNWHHIAFTYDGTADAGGLKTYVDGGNLESFQLASTGISTIDTLGTFIGTLQVNNGWRFTGNISNIQIWDTVLEDGSEETLYNNGTPLTTAIQSANLKGWWKLDDTSTFSTNWTVPDASGNGNDGTSSGMTEQSLVNNNVSALNGESSGMTSGNLVLSDLTRNLPYENYSLSFDAGSAETISATVPTLDNATALTFSGWFKKDSGNAVGFESIQASDNRVILYWWTDNNVYWSVRNGSLSANINSSLTNYGSWNHLVGVFDGASNSIELYINGVSVAFSNSGQPSSTSANLSTNFIIGLSNALQYNTGNICQLSIFDNALTSTEVLKLYANGLPQDLTNFTPQPSHWWTLGKESFWNGSDWIVRDMIGSNDGTSTNMAVSDLVGDAPRSEANGTGTNMDIPTNLVGNAGFSDKNAYSINMGPSARVTDTP